MVFLLLLLLSLLLGGGERERERKREEREKVRVICDETRRLRVTSMSHQTIIRYYTLLFYSTK